MRSGVIIAGGRSTRFGATDKAVAELAGVPMIRRVADRLSPTVDELVVNCRVDQEAAIDDALAGIDLPVSTALDPEPDLGPIAGIATGLRAVEGAYGVVVACDMPFVDPDFVDMLFERVRGHEAVVPRPDDWFQTTQAAYHADAMAEACERTLAEGEHRIVDALFDLEYVVLDRSEVEAHSSMETFENLNTRDEFEAAQDRFD